jgi:hypothetical protein
MASHRLEPASSAAPTPNAPIRRWLVASILAALTPDAMAGEAPGTSGPSACDLFEPAATAALFGAPVQGRAGHRAGDGLEISSCFLRVQGSSRSAYVELRESAADARASRHWAELFHAPASGEAEPRRKSRRLRGDAPAAPAREPAVEALPVEQLGDEAFFVGTAVYGALYVRHGARYLRLSVGGAGALEDKLDLARSLAAQALAGLDRLAVGPDEAPAAASVPSSLPEQVFPNR